MSAEDSPIDPPTVLVLKVVNVTTRVASYYHVPVEKYLSIWARREGPCRLSSIPTA